MPKDAAGRLIPGRLSPPRRVPAGIPRPEYVGRPAPDRVGPFETRAEAERALEILRANSAKWAEEEAAED